MKENELKGEERRSSGRPFTWILKWQRVRENDEVAGFGQGANLKELRERQGM